PQPPPFQLLDLQECPRDLSFLSGPAASENQQPTTTLRYNASSSCLRHDRGRSFEPGPRGSEDLVEERSQAQPETTTPNASGPRRPRDYSAWANGGKTKNPPAN